MGSGVGAGTETRAVAEMGTGTRIGAGTGMRTRSARAEEMRGSARNRRRVVGGIRHLPSARVIMQRGTLGHPTAPFARPGVYTRTSHRKGNRVQGTGRSERGRERGQSRGRERKRDRGRRRERGRKR